MDLGEHDEPDYTLINQGGPLGSSDLDQIDLQSLSPAILSTLQQLDPERQRRALEMLLAEQQAEEDQIMQQLPDEHFLTIALNGEYRSNSYSNDLDGSGADTGRW